MIIVRTPLRISLLGGGTDVPEWTKTERGLVLGGAINQYSYLTGRKTPKFLEYTTKLVYSETEIVNSNHDIKHRAIKAALYTYCVNFGVEITHTIDIPGRSGTGSSSSFLVGLINLISMIKGNPVFDKATVTTHAVSIERHHMKESVGSQDQTWASYGGFRAIEFIPSVSVDDIRPSNNLLNDEGFKSLENECLLFYTGKQRIASQIAKTYYGKLSPAENYAKQKEMIALTEGGIADVVLKDWRSLGQKVGQGWEIKKSFSPEISTSEIDMYYKEALNCGAYGGKLMGVGSAGCFFLMAPRHTHYDIIESLHEWVHIPFKFDREGSKVIFNGAN